MKSTAVDVADPIAASTPAMTNALAAIGTRFTSATIAAAAAAAIAHFVPTNIAKRKKQIAPAMPPAHNAQGGSSARALAPLASVGVREVRCSTIGSVMDQSFLAATLGRRYGTLSAINFPFSVESARSMQTASHVASGRDSVIRTVRHKISEMDRFNDI
jgi:hypothetical protein